MLTQEQIEEIKRKIGGTQYRYAKDISLDKVTSSGNSAADIWSKLETESSLQNQEREKPKFFADTKKDIKKRADKLGEIADSDKSLFQKSYETGAQAVGSLWDIAGNALNKTFDLITPDVIEDPIRDKASDVAAKIGSTAPVQAVASWYDKLKEEKPNVASFLGASAEYASLLPVEKLLGVGGKATAKSSQAISKAGKAVSDTVGSINKTAFSKFSGLTPDSIEFIIKNPKAISKEAMKTVDRLTIGGKVKEAITKRMEDLGSLGKEYEAIRKSTDKVNLNRGAIEDILKNKGFAIENGLVKLTRESMPIDPGELSKLQTFLDRYAINGKISANALMQARSYLSEISKFGSAETGAFQALAKELRSYVDEVGGNAIKGLKELDSRYAPEKKLLNQIKKDYINPINGELKDGALNKIANLNGIGKDLVLKRLEEIVPGISRDINILKVLENIDSLKGKLVGTYSQGILAGGSLLTGNLPAAAATMLLSSPATLIPLLRSYGTYKGIKNSVIDTIINKMNKGINLLGEEKALIDDVVKGWSDSFNKKANETLDKMKPGMTIDDVSKKGEKMLSDEIKIGNVNEITPKEGAIIDTFLDRMRSDKSVSKELQLKAARIAEKLDLSDMPKDIDELAGVLDEAMRMLEGKEIIPKKIEGAIPGTKEYSGASAMAASSPMALLGNEEKKDEQIKEFEIKPYKWTDNLKNTFKFLGQDLGFLSKEDEPFAKLPLSQKAKLFTESVVEELGFTGKKIPFAVRYMGEMTKLPVKTVLSLSEIPETLKSGKATQKTVKAYDYIPSLTGNNVQSFFSQYEDDVKSGLSEKEAFFKNGFESILGVAILGKMANKLVEKVDPHKMGLTIKETDKSYGKGRDVTAGKDVESLTIKKSGWDKVMSKKYIDQRLSDIARKVQNVESKGSTSMDITTPVAKKIMGLSNTTLKSAKSPGQFYSSVSKLLNQNADKFTTSQMATIKEGLARTYIDTNLNLLIAKQEPKTFQMLIDLIYQDK